jgi:voltage-gated potassium channel
MIINPEWTVFIIFSTTIAVFGYILRIFELPYFRLENNPDVFRSMDRYFNSIYLTVITMTTTGYGDISPSTTPGRITAMVIALFGTFLISIVVVTVSSIFDLSHS